MDWEGVRVSEDGTCLRVVYITGTRRPADRVDVKWEPEHVTLTLSQMGDGGATTAMAVYHCVEVPLSHDISDRILIDGATGEPATEKKSSHLDPELLSDTELTLDSVFEPHELLEPREISG
jgi:hypothetical protein